MVLWDFIPVAQKPLADLTENLLFREKEQLMRQKKVVVMVPVGLESQRLGRPRRTPAPPVTLCVLMSREERQKGRQDTEIHVLSFL